MTPENWAAPIPRPINRPASTARPRVLIPSPQLLCLQMSQTLPQMLTEHLEGPWRIQAACLSSPRSPVVLFLFHRITITKPFLIIQSCLLLINSQACNKLHGWGKNWPSYPHVPWGTLISWTRFPGPSKAKGLHSVAQYGLWELQVGSNYRKKEGHILIGTCPINHFHLSAWRSLSVSPQQISWTCQNSE